MMDTPMEERFTPDQLATWRKSYGWSQEQAAARIGLSYNGYIKKEQGKRSLTGQDMKLIRYVDQDEAKTKVKKKATA
jgi:transcriptional regulator with XRE-family HTH domain